MLTLRNADKSVAKKVTDLFTTPVGTWPPIAWNVYLEDSYMSASFVPTDPYLYLLDYRVRPLATKLPLVIVERAQTPHQYFELGNRSGHLFTYNLHVFGRNRGERSDLAAYLEANFDSIDLYDFTGASPVLVETQTVLDRVLVPNVVTPDVGVEGTLENAISLLVAFQTMI